MNLALLQFGYVITLIPPVLRQDYLNSLKASNRGDNKPFINLMIGMVYESQKDYFEDSSDSQRKVSDSKTHVEKEGGIESGPG